MDFERSLAARREVLGMLGSGPEAERKSTLVRSLLLQNLIELNLPEEAAREARALADARSAEKRAVDPTLIAVRNCEGWALTNMGKAHDAVEVLTLNAAEGVRSLGARSPNTCAANVLRARARVFESPTPENAEALRAMLDELGTKDDTMAAVARAWRPILVECLLKAGRREDAATEAAAFLRAGAAGTESRTASEYHLGRVLHEGGLEAECIAPLENAYQQLVMGPGASSWICKRIAGMVAAAHQSLGHADRAADWKQRAGQ
jgi:hypothetical protein